MSYLVYSFNGKYGRNNKIHTVFYAGTFDAFKRRTLKECSDRFSDLWKLNDAKITLFGCQH